jgi:hypothetical protein
MNLIHIELMETRESTYLISVGTRLESFYILTIRNGLWHRFFNHWASLCVNSLKVSFSYYLFLNSMNLSVLENGFLFSSVVPNKMYDRQVVLVLILHFTSIKHLQFSRERWRMRKICRKYFFMWYRSWNIGIFFYSFSLTIMSHRV